MATTTATLTLTSSDLASDALSLSATKTCYKAGTTLGLDQTTGLAKTYLTATTNIDIFVPVPGTTMAGKNGKVYIANLSTEDTEYIIVTKGGNVIGRLYAGDWMWMPMEQKAQHLSDVEIAPSVATGMWVEYMMIHEGIVLTTSADS
jgi:hypothetical protein